MKLHKRLGRLQVFQLVILRLHKTKQATIISKCISKKNKTLTIKCVN